MKRLFFLLLFSSLVFAKSVEPTALDKQIISYTFNENFEQAKKISQEQIKLNPNSPKYYYYMINCKILEYYKRITDLHPDKRDEGRKAINKELIEYCENIIDKFEDSKLNTENQFYLGSIYGYLTRIHGLDRSWWGAFKTGMKAEDIMEDVLKSDPQFYDAYLVLGMMNYYADRLSGITSLVAGILGYSGDRDKGLYQLKLAFEKGKITFGQSALTLIEVYANLEDNEEEAISYYEKFLKQFPYSKRALNGYFQKLVSAGEFDKASNVIKNDDKKLLDDYTLAMYYNAKGNSGQALSYAEKAIADKNKLWRGWLDYIYYIAAFNSWLTGNNDKVAKYEKELNDDFKKYFSIERKNEKESKWIASLAAQSASGISVSDFEILIKSKPNFDKMEGFEDQYNIICGKYYLKNNITAKAEQYFTKSINAGDEGNKYSALKNIMNIYMKQNVDKSKVEKLVDIIDDFDNDRLKFRAKDLEKKYNL